MYEMKKKKRARQPLSRDRVLRAALLLADEAGLDALSMRKLAHELSVEAMSLYKHVANREEVLLGVVDLVVSEIDLPTPDVAWKQALRARAISARSVLHRHPWAILLVQSLSPTPVRLRHNDLVLGVMRSQGFSLMLAYRAFLLLDSYIYGFTTQELSWRSEDPVAVEDTRTEMVPDQYPYFSEVFAHVTKLVEVSGATAAYDAEFNFGLDLILDSLDRLRDAFTS